LACNGGEVTEANETSGTGTDSETGDSCIVGQLDCACTAGGGCDPGLECVADVCVEVSDETETGECVGIDCDCDGDEDCDPGLACVDGVCEATDCGNGELDPGEDCDDGNVIGGDGCDTDCSYTEILEISAGGVHTCALIEGGRVRCWGHNGAGQTGYGENEDIGDNEQAKAAGDLPLAAAVDVVAGPANTCALFENGDARCWGFNTSGQLGLGNSAMLPALGDDESIEGLAKVDLIAPVNEIGIGLIHVCARAAGQLRCWGGGNNAQLGIQMITNIGDNELPLDVPAVNLGGEPVQLAIGGNHACALLATGGVRCFGRNDNGQCGLGTNQAIGDNEDPADMPEVEVIAPNLPRDTTVVSLGVGLVHSCALLSTGDVICWGATYSGQLGQGDGQITWGNDANESPADLPPIELGGPAVALAVGFQHNCALLDSGDVRCWGLNDSGQLGQGHDQIVGLNDVPADHDPIELGGRAIMLSAGGEHTCAVLEDHGVICWGDNNYGQLGYGFTHDIGDDELPETAGEIDLL
jgi:cysteine-rich repeat protein